MEMGRYHNMAAKSMEMGTTIWQPNQWKYIPQSGYQTMEMGTIIWLPNQWKRVTAIWLPNPWKWVSQYGYQIHGNGYRNMAT